MTGEEFTDLVEFHYSGGPFRGFDCLGYIGNQDRNYVTDAWVVAGANALGWTLVELSEWMCSMWGRWTLDRAPMSAEEMRQEMANADLDELLAEAAS